MELIDTKVVDRKNFNEKDLLDIWAKRELLNPWNKRGKTTEGEIYNEKSNNKRDSQTGRCGRGSSPAEEKESKK